MVSTQRSKLSCIHTSEDERGLQIPQCHVMTLVWDHHLLQTGTVVSVLIRFYQEKLPEMLVTARLVRTAAIIKLSTYRGKHNACVPSQEVSHCIVFLFILKVALL